jgi:general secretion pathway protein N
MISNNLHRGLVVALLVLGTAAGFAAAPNGASELDIRPNAGTIDIERTPARPAMPMSPAAEPLPSGNPLWAIPLRELSATRERPIFSPSRRPPPPAVAAAPYVVAAAVSKPVEPDRPQLSLVGTIAGETDGFGIFLDKASNKVMRLKLSEAHQGWVLRRVRAREAVLEKQDQTVVLALPNAREQTAAPPQREEEQRRGRR